MRCAACGQIRPLAELVAFWPVDRPSQRRYVCRPSVAPSRASFRATPCFASVVRPAVIHAIAFAETPAPLERPEREPVRPWTQAWDQLLASAGVRL